MRYRSGYGQRRAGGLNERSGERGEETVGSLISQNLQQKFLGIFFFFFF